MENEFATDYYRFLGVERNASQQSILRAFRQKSRQYHPDKVEGNEEMMKLLTQIKVTLLDPDKKEKYDDTYEPNSEETAQQLSEKLYLYSGRKLSESYIQKIEFWKKEIKFIELNDNIEVIGEKWVEMREELNKIHIYKAAHPLSNEYENYLKDNIKEDLNSGLKKLFPENIWNLNALKKSSGVWIKLSSTTLSKANEYFNRGEFETALVHFSHCGNNSEILSKAHYLFLDHKYNECLLYCRYLMNVSKYCPQPVLMSLKISEKTGLNIYKELLSAAKHYWDDPDIQKLMFEKLKEKKLFIEMNNLLENNSSLKSEIQEKNPLLIKEINSKVEENNYQLLKQFVYKSDFKSVVEFILSHQCQRAVKKVFTELTLGRKTDQELPPSFRSMLLVLKGCALLFNEDYVQSFKCFREALYTYPLENTMEAIITLLQSGQHTKDCMDNFLTQLKIEELTFPTVHKYVEVLKSSQMLRTVVRYEKSIQNQKLSHFEKAMLYIDLCMACAHPLILANNLCLAANHLLQNILAQSLSFETVYAFRNTICDLCATVLFFVNKYLDPIGVTHFSRLTFILMDRAHISLSKSRRLAQAKTDSVTAYLSSKDMIDERHKSLFTLINHMISKSLKVNPLIQINLTLSADLLLVNLVNHQFLEKYYNFMIEKHPKHPLNYMFKYYLFEGNWKNWFAQDTFDNSRLNCMKSLLDKNNLKINKMGTILNWPVLRRDKNGWINSKRSKLNLAGKAYTSVDGLTLDMENGTYQLHLSSKRNEPKLISDADIAEVFENGLSHCMFSLDQADFDLEYFPFQQMRYSPKNLKNTSYLSTVFHADYLLKMFAMNTEVSAQSPFGFKSASNGLLDILPDELREKIKLTDTKDSNYGRVHRFWIEAEELQFKEAKLDKNKKQITFTACPMAVKEHLLTQNSEGEYVDDIDDDEDFCNSLFNISAEKRFAQNFTENYDKIGYYFPIFRRLRELLKLNAILGILRNIYETMEEAKESVEIDQGKIRNILRQLKEQVTYPINTEANVNDMFQRTLRANGVTSEYQVDHSEVIRVKKEIRNNLAEAETELFNKLTSSLVEGLEIRPNSNLRGFVQNWIMYNNEMAMVNQLCMLIKEKEIERLTKFGNYLKKNKINLDKKGINFEMVSEKDGWVPAAFSLSDDRKCYGGVCLIPRLSEARQPPPPPPSNSGGNRNIWSHQTRNKENFNPIKDSSGRTVRVYQTIRPCDLNSGESTAKNRSLAAETRAQGLKGDDCGHIWGKAIGGPMNKDNVFSQNQAVNRGQYRALENQVKTYLEDNKSDFHAKARINIHMIYRDLSDRPVGVGYECSFIKHGNKLADVCDIPRVGRNPITSNPYRTVMLNKDPKQK